MRSLLVKSFKYFIDYKDSKIVRPLSPFPQKMSAQRRSFDELNICFFIKEDEYFGKKLKIVSKINSQ